MLNAYQSLELQGLGIWLEEVQLGLGLWQGSYQGVHRHWLRWYDKEGHWIPTAVELAQEQAEQQSQRADQEHRRADQEHRRAERLAAQLRSLGIDPG